MAHWQWRGRAAALQAPVGPGTRVEDPRRRMFERFFKITPADEAFECAQVFDRPVHHHMGKEMRRLRQGLRSATASNSGVAGNPFTALRLPRCRPSMWVAR